MDDFEVLESDRFKGELEEVILWLYSHNLEQSQEFADQKYFELQQEVNTLKNHLKRNPRMGQADDVSGIRRFPLYSGRYIATWLLIEAQRTAILLEFIDSKYPKELRQVQLEE
ncbi:MAG: hypothetical protein H6626_10635 [Pseudobdellovibrionaceae bacterium]|nr:hypothetical protein [Bdellovibrionales bacterium]USN46663.1 MAG: hypothetical protein H6626_10635 [Pseudobdellovibrionaceae bacterium]